MTLQGIPSFHDVFQPLLAGIRNITNFSSQLRISETLNNSFPTFAVHCVTNHVRFVYNTVRIPAKHRGCYQASDAVTYQPSFPGYM
jgi:hypothetical protein